MALTAHDRTIRQGRITGTRLGALLGLSKYKRPIDVYREIVEGHNQVIDSDEADWGNILEPALVTWTSSRLNASVAPGEATVHPTDQRFAATPDGILCLPDQTYAVLECKAPRLGEDWGEAGTDDIPRYHMTQVQLEMACTNLPLAYVCAAVWGRPRIYQVGRNDDFIAFVMGVGDRFWRQHIEPQIAPPNDGSEQWEAWVNARHPAPTTETIADVDDESPITAYAREYLEANARIKDLTERKRVAANELRQAIGANKGIRGDGWRALWGKYSRKKPNWEAYARHLGGNDEGIAAFVQHETSRRLDVRKVKAS